MFHFSLVCSFFLSLMCDLFVTIGEHKMVSIGAALAKDYLACSGNTCPVERTFSLAADVCEPDCGGLNLSTMERGVGCREWIKAGVPTPDTASIK